MTERDILIRALNLADLALESVISKHREEVQARGDRWRWQCDLPLMARNGRRVIKAALAGEALSLEVGLFTISIKGARRIRAEAGSGFKPSSEGVKQELSSGTGLCDKPKSETGDQ